MPYQLVIKIQRDGTFWVATVDLGEGHVLELGRVSLLACELDHDIYEDFQALATKMMSKLAYEAGLKSVNYRTVEV